jgi:hypothetical protein
MSERSEGSAWGRLIFGLVLGVAAGLGYAWFVNPVNYVDIQPSQLKRDVKEQYIIVVGQAYLQDLDLARAQARLAAAGVQNPAETVSQQADQAFARSASPEYIRALTVLAEALGGHPQAAEVFSGTAVAPGVDRLTPTSTFDAVPSLTPSATALPPTQPIPTPTETPVLIPSDATMKLVAEQTLCDAEHAAGQLQVYVLDISGAGIPGVKVLINWEGGSDVFFSGLKPEIDPGYGDFEMQADQVYSVTLVGLAEPVVGLTAVPCTTEDDTIQMVTYELTFAPVTNQ